MSKPIRWLLLLLPLLIPLPVTAQSDTGANRGDALSIKLAVLGPGDALYLAWGHIGIIVEDTLSGESRFYDYGLFSFDTEDFFVNFAFGRLIFMVGTSPVDWNLAKAKKDNRELILMTLNLSGEAKAGMKAFLEDNALPENRTYLYHHYWNNCATKVRDILDQFTDGQIRRFTANKPARMTLRAHGRRHLEKRPFFDWFLPFIMGPLIDAPVTVWDELFLPSEFLRVFKDFTYRDGNGMERPLVSRIETYYSAENRKPVLKDSPSLRWSIFFVSLALAAAAGAGGRFYPRGGGRLLLGSLNLGVGLFFGGLGTLLFFMSFFTDHDFTYNNLNLLFINPLLLALIPLGIKTWRRPKLPRPSSLFALRLIWTVAASTAVAAGILSLLPFFIQNNGATLVLFLPCALAMSHYPRWIKALFKGIHSLLTSPSP